MGERGCGSNNLWSIQMKAVAPTKGYREGFLAHMSLTIRRCVVVSNPCDGRIPESEFRVEVSGF